MEKKKVLKPKQQLAVRLLALGEQKKIVAERLEVSVMTIYRWEQTPAFQTQLESLHSSGLEATARMLNKACLTAAETVQELLCDMREPGAVRLKAALGILRAFPALNAAVERGVLHRAADFNIKERWAEVSGTYNGDGKLIERRSANAAALVVNPDGSVTL